MTGLSGYPNGGRRCSLDWPPADGLAARSPDLQIDRSSPRLLRPRLRALLDHDQLCVFVPLDRAAVRRAHLTELEGRKPGEDAPAKRPLRCSQRLARRTTARQSLEPVQQSTA